MNQHLHSHLSQNRYSWLVTGAAGFIGSNLCTFLLEHNQVVKGFDNFSTGHQHNIDDIRALNGDFEFIEGDIRSLESCRKAAIGIDFVLHQAALGSVPRSIADPLTSHNVNVDGFINILKSATENKVKRFVFASSSSVYGDSTLSPKHEPNVGKVISPYAATKVVNELYAMVFQRTYGLSTVGLRYFNVFGPRQDPNGQYAAVIPKWATALIENREIVINGDGTTSRDFCYIENVVQANVASAISSRLPDQHVALNIAFGESTSLIDLVKKMASLLNAKPSIRYAPFRTGDVMHSLADVSLAQELIGYDPQYSLTDGLAKAMPWYLGNATRLAQSKG